MSRVFTAGSNVQAPASAVYNNLAAATVAAWVYPTAGGFGIIVIKDPTNTYDYFLTFTNGGSTLGFGPTFILSPTYGRIADINHAPVAGGTGYAPGDTGFISNPNDPTYRRAYVVQTVGGGGAVTDVDHTGASNPYNYTVGTKTTVTGGAQPGSGSGMTIAVTAINGQAPQAESVDALTLNTWSHVAATWNSGGDGVPRLYINGVEVTYSGQQRISKTAPTGDQGDGWWMGSDGFGDDWEGNIAEVAIYSTALSSLAVAALAAATTGATGSPVGYWHLCGTASPEPDSSGNGNDGVLSVPSPTAGGNSPGYSSCTAAAYSIPDCRDYSIFPNNSVTIQGTKQYTVNPDPSHTDPVDSRTAGAPVDSRQAANKPQNCRTDPPFGA